MKTESGALSIGAPFSDARFKAEIDHVLEAGPYALLFTTNEGAQTFQYLCKAMGWSWEIMLEPQNRASTITTLEDASLRVDLFLRGVLFGLKTKF